MHSETACSIGSSPGDTLARTVTKDGSLSAVEGKNAFVKARHGKRQSLTEETLEDDGSCETVITSEQVNEPKNY